MKSVLRDAFFFGLNLKYLILACDRGSRPWIALLKWIGSPRPILCYLRGKMHENEIKIQALLAKVNELLRRENEFRQEILGLRIQMEQLKQELTNSKPIDHSVPVENAIFEPIEVEPNTTTDSEPIAQPKLTMKAASAPGSPSALEKFIGENLINKIGILITIIGVGIGAKYSIENNLISPVTRILLGYAAGIALFGVGYRLKTNYHNFSSVLVSGSITILYFITYFAYSAYELIPGSIAFVLMILLNALSIGMALRYNQQIVALLGLVGAYATPFLLSNDSGNIPAFFTYITLIDVAILIIALRKTWRWVYISSFAVTWLIYITWLLGSYSTNDSALLALVFALVFYLIFLVTFVFPHLISNESMQGRAVIPVLLNSLFFFGAGYTIITAETTDLIWPGVFTLLLSAFHLAMMYALQRSLPLAQVAIRLMGGLGLLFFTLFFPIVFDTHWITVFWASEALLLLWLCRHHDLSELSLASKIVAVLAFCSLQLDWMAHYAESNSTIDFQLPFINGVFATSLFCAFVYFFIRQWQDTLKPTSHKFLAILDQFYAYLIPALLLYILLFAPQCEIGAYWSSLERQAYLASLHDESGSSIYLSHSSYDKFSNLWQTVYVFCYTIALFLYNQKKSKNNVFAIIVFGLFALSLLRFLVSGLFELSRLSYDYFHPSGQELMSPTVQVFWLKYALYAILGGLFYVSRTQIRTLELGFKLRHAWEVVANIVVLWIVCFEINQLLGITALTDIDETVSLIFCGVYALSLIVVGIRQKKQHLRILAFVVLGLVLIYFCLLTFPSFNTIQKTIVCIVLGALLLTVSYLYNRIKRQDEKNSTPIEQ
jgi:hypothetical protein